MPNVSQQKGGFSNPDKIAVKFMGDRGVKMGVQLRDTLAKSLAEASDLKKFLAPAERKQVKEMSAADRVQFFVNKINSGAPCTFPCVWLPLTPLQVSTPSRSPSRRS